MEISVHHFEHAHWLQVYIFKYKPIVQDVNTKYKPTHPIKIYKILIYIIIYIFIYTCTIANKYIKVTDRCYIHDIPPTTGGYETTGLI